MLLANRNVLKDYSEELDKLHRSKKISITKNNQEIKKFQDDAEDNIRNLKNEITTSKKVYIESMDLAEAKFNRETLEALKAHDEEIESIDYELKLLREDYRVLIRKVESEKAKKVRLINDKFNNIESEIEAKISARRKLADNDIEIIKLDTKEHKKNTDETYLTIKKTHTQTSIKFNDFINNRKKEHVTKISNLKETYENDLIPLEKAKETIKIANQDELDLIQTKYAARVQTLNIQFDLQKELYNEQIGNIIKANSLTKSKLNADFSALNQSIEELKHLEKNKLSKAILRKDISDIEKDKSNREYKQKTDELNKRLSLAIKTNKQQINELEIKLQDDLFNHDLKHIEQINDWRYNKNIYEYENNQNILKSKKKYDLELLKITLDEKLLKLNLNNDLLIEGNTLKRDLLPIESQLLISSLVQEREINLLNTDDETYHNIYNINQDIITNKYFLDEVVLRNELNLAQEEKRKNDAAITIETQLELEQLKLKRNHSLNILQLNKDLQLSLLHQKNNIETIKRDSIVFEANLNINNLEARSLYETKSFRKDALMELEKRQAIIHEIKIKSQRQALENKVERTVMLAKNEANLHEKVNQSLFNHIFVLYQISENISTLVESLFKLPSHPETFRQFASKVIVIFNHLKNEFKFLIDKYTTIDNELFHSRITSMTEHKYRIKHEEIINIYSNNINQIVAKRDELLKQYKDIEGQVILIQKKKALNNSIIDNYLKINKNNHSTNRKQLIRYNKIQINILKDEIQLLNRNQNESNKEIIRLSNKVLPLDRQIKRLEKHQLHEEEILDNQKHHEVISYLNLQKQHINSYSKFSTTLNKKIDTLNSIYQTLIEKPYISDNFFIGQKSKIDKTILSLMNSVINNQQMFLDSWLELFNITKNDQYKMFDNFLKSTNYALDKIAKNHKRFLENEQNEKNHYSKNYENESKRNSDLIIKAKESMKQSIKDYQTAYRETYNKIEIDIENNKIKTDREIEIISENLKGVKTDFDKEHASNKNKIEKNTTKKQLEFNNLITSKNKDLNDVIKRNDIRTKVTIDRYEKNKERNLKVMKHKHNRFTDDNKNINQIKLNDELNYKVTIKKSEKLFELNKKEIDQIVIKYFRTTRREQNKIVKKEKKILIHGYKFKIKQLK